MKTIVKVNGKSNDHITENLLKFPYYTIRCKLAEILSDRGIKMQELADITGVRIATISEIANMKRTTLNVPHLLVIASALRITDIGELFEIIMPDSNYSQFIADKKVIELNGILPEHQEILDIKKEQKKPTSN